MRIARLKDFYSVYVSIKRCRYYDSKALFASVHLAENDEGYYANQKFNGKYRIYIPDDYGCLPYIGKSKGRI